MMRVLLLLLWVALFRSRLPKPLGLEDRNLFSCWGTWYILSDKYSVGLALFWFRLWYRLVESWGPSLRKARVKLANSSWARRKYTRHAPVRSCSILEADCWEHREKTKYPSMSIWSQPDESSHLSKLDPALALDNVNRVAAQVHAPRIDSFSWYSPRLNYGVEFESSSFLRRG